MKKIYSNIILVMMAVCCVMMTSCSDDDIAADKYPAPTVSGFSPSKGLPTSIVTINGSNFGNERTERVGRVYFGGVEATDYVSYSDNQIQVRVPEGAESGPIDVWVWKKHVTTEEEFTYIPGAEVKSIEPAEAYPGSEITLLGINFGTFMELPLSDILVEFQTADGSEKVEATSLTETELKVTVPINAKSGALTVYFGDQQTVTTPELTLVGDYTFTLLDYVEKGGTISIAEGNIDSTKDGAWVIYQFKAPATGFFEVNTLTGTTKDGSYLNVDISDNLNVLKTQAENERLTQVMPNTGSWATTAPMTFGTFYLEAGQTYYLRLLFLQDGSTWVGNLGELKITLSADQNAAGGEQTLVFTDFIDKSGTISIAEGNIDSTKDGAWVIFQFKTPLPGLFDVCTQTGTTKDGSSLNIDISDDLNTLKTQAVNENLTKVMPNTGGWAVDAPLTFGPFELKANKTYYMKITFLQEGSTWVGNLHEVKITLSADQNATPVNGGGGGQARDYVLYENNFNNGESYSPFRDSWAWNPCYIKVVDKSLEFYYNQAALDADNRRERRGCEVTCDFKTTKDGWYGFKILLPKGKFPKDLDGSIIAQIFNSGDKNSWAGHLSLNKNQLVMSHRYALIDPTVGTVGTVEWDKWIPVVMYFKAGKNKKGRIKVWMGDNMQEGSPAYDSGAVDFGFGKWVDDETLDGTVSASNEKADYLGCKFGLYVSSGGDRTIRFDDLKVLEGNPAGAFNIVKP